MENWNVFWQDQKSGFDGVMKHTTRFFFEKYFRMSSQKNYIRVLDYGCGPGFLVKDLAAFGKEVVGADISRSYINFCREEFKANEKVVFELLTDDSTLEKILFKHHPDLIVVMSVIQYFESERVLKDFLDQIKNYVSSSERNVKVVIADIIPLKHSKISDAKDLFKESLRGNYLLEFFKFIYGIFFSNYSDNKLSVKQFDPVFFENYASENHVEISFLNKVTIHSSRYSVELKFSGGN